MAQTLDAPLEAVVSSQRVGPVLKVYRFAPPLLSNVTLSWIGGGVFVAIGAFFTLGAFVATSGAIPAALAAGCFLGALLSFLSAHFRIGERHELNQRQRCYAVCRGALILREADGCSVVPWECLEGYRKALGRLEITTADQKTFTLNGGVEGFGELIGYVIGKVAERLLPAMHDRIARGETVTAGALGVSRHGLLLGGVRIGWEEISELRMVSFRGSIPELQVRRSGRWSSWCSQDLSKVPNYEVMVRLLESVCPRHLLRPAG